MAGRERRPFIAGRHPQGGRGMSDEREKFIASYCARTGKSREQAEAFLDVLGSGLRRRGLIPGEPLPQSAIKERLDTFMGDREPEDPDAPTIVDRCRRCGEETTRADLLCDTCHQRAEDLSNRLRGVR